MVKLSHIVVYFLLLIALEEDEVTQLFFVSNSGGEGKLAVLSHALSCLWLVTGR